jgi:hypothetical protein
MITCADREKLNYSGQIIDKIGDICLTPEECQQHQRVQEEWDKLVRTLKERE